MTEMTEEIIDPNYKPASQPAPQPVPVVEKPEYQPEKPGDEPEEPEYKAEKPEKPDDKPEKPDYKPERPEKPEKPEEPEYKPERPEKPEKPEKPDGKPEKPDYKPERPEKPDGNGDGGPQGGHHGGPGGGSNVHHHHHHHHHADGGTHPAGMPFSDTHHHNGHNGHGGPGGHDCPISAGLVATLELQSLPDFNVEEDFIVLNKEIFTALESEGGDGFSVEEEFVVIGEGPTDATGAVFVYNVLDMTLYYDTNGAEAGFGEDGGAIFEFAEIVGNAEGLGVRDFFLIGSGGPGVHGDRLVNEGLVATLDLQTLPEFNVEEDFVILSKEIFAALESEEGDGFSVETEFAVAEEGSADITGAVFVFAADGAGGGSLIYDANGTDSGFGDGGEILDIAQITGNADGLGVNDFFIVL